MSTAATANQPARLQGMAGSRSWRTSSASGYWADAGLDEPTAHWNGTRQACGVALKTTYQSMTLQNIKNISCSHVTAYMAEYQRYRIIRMLREFWGPTSFKEALMWGAAISIFAFFLVLQRPEPLGVAVKILIKAFFFSTFFMFALKNILWIICSRISSKSLKYLNFEDLYIQKKRHLRQKTRDSERGIYRRKISDYKSQWTESY